MCLKKILYFYIFEKQFARPINDTISIINHIDVGIMAHYWNSGYTIGMVVATLLKMWLTIGMVAILLK